MRRGISPAAHVSPSASFAEDVDVHPGATIGDDVTIGTGSTIHAGAHIMAGCKLGERVTIFPGAVLYESTVVGNDVILHAGAVLGTYGVGYDTVDGAHQLGAQLGHVVVEDNVEIGACTTVDRGTYGPTVIGEGTKIDNQVMVAHNCRIGRHNVICSQVGIAGSTTTGIPATPERIQLHQLAAVGKLPEMRKQLRRVERLVEQLVSDKEPPQAQDAA